MALTVGSGGEVAEAAERLRHTRCRPRRGTCRMPSRALSRQHRAQAAGLPLVPVELVVGVEEELVFDRCARYRGAPGWLRSRKVAVDAGLVVEPVVGGQRAVAVVPVDRAVKGVGAGFGGKHHLRRAAADGRAGIRGGHRDFGDLVDGGAHRRVVQVVGADEVVLDVDAVQRDVGEGTAQAVDRGRVAARRDPRLGQEQGADLAAEHRQILHLRGGDRGRHSRRCRVGPPARPPQLPRCALDCTSSLDRRQSRSPESARP